MSISIELSRLQANRNTIRAKLVELGLATNTAKLDALAAALENLINRGAVNAEVKEGETYTIPAGYHDGSGVVSGVAGGGNYILQTKSVTPTKKQQAISSDEGYYGLSSVTVTAIPDNYQDVSSVTAAAGDVLTGKVYVTADGTVVTGTMVNNGAVSKSLDVTTISYTIPKGFHNGSGKVTITLEEKTVTPTKSAQTITPASGKVLSKVTVEAIPAAYQNVTNVDATEADVLVGKTIVDSRGNEIAGTMTDNGAKTASIDAGSYYIIPAGYHNGQGKVTGNSLASQTVGTAETKDILYGETAWVGGTKKTGTMKNNGATGGNIDGLTVTSVTIPAGYTTGGSVDLTDDIETALAAI